MKNIVDYIGRMRDNIALIGEELGTYATISGNSSLQELVILDNRNRTPQKHVIMNPEHQDLIKTMQEVRKKMKRINEKCL